MPALQFEEGFPLTNVNPVLEAMGKNTSYQSLAVTHGSLDGQDMPMSIRALAKKAVD